VSNFFNPTWKLTKGVGPSDTADNFGGADQPKVKYFYTVEFGFGRGVNHDPGSDQLQSISFACKQATRPTVNINYTDINFYNYRTKVGTRVDYGVVTLTFYDDNNNKAHDMFQNYLNFISPISNTSRESAGSLETLRPATHGSLQNTHGPLSYITVNHHYSKDGSERKVKYNYLNPKIQNATLDELDMTQSDTNSVTITFVYDAVNIEKE
jgi:hypothetical protein